MEGRVHPTVKHVHGSCGIERNLEVVKISMLSSPFAMKCNKCH